MSHLFNYLVREELQESKGFRDDDTMRKYSSKELRDICFLMFISLHLLSRTRFHRDAKAYATETMKYPLFDRVYLSGTDLGNIISTLVNARKILDERDVNMPLLDIKRYLSDYKFNKMTSRDVSSFFYLLQVRMNICDTSLLSFRRNIVDEEEISWDRLKFLADQVYRKMKIFEYRSDVLALLQRLIDCNHE